LVGLERFLQHNRRDDQPQRPRPVRMTYTHTLTRSPRGWHFQALHNGEPDGISTPMRSSKIADRAGQDYVDRRNGAGCIERRLRELGL